MASEMVQGIMEILNEAYGDKGMSPLDRVAANKIVQYFQSEGWVTSKEVAIIINAAGGSVFVSMESIEDSGTLILKSFRDFEHDGIQFKVIDTSKAKVNPDAESRNVKSGPIKVKPYPRGAEGYVRPNPGPHS